MYTSPSRVCSSISEAIETVRVRAAEVRGLVTRTLARAG